MWDNILLTISTFRWYEWLAFISGILYVTFAARGKRIGWLFGILSCGIWAYADCLDYLLYIDGLLQVFYVGMGIYGWIQWTSNQTHSGTLDIVSKNWFYHLPYLVFGLLISLVLGYYFSEYTPAAATYPDAITTVFSIYATYLTVTRQLEGWIYWILIDITYIYITISREAYLYALLFLIYTIIAVSGYISWKKMRIRQVENSTG